MNPHFSVTEQSDYYRIPTRVYARVDSVDETADERLIIGIDAVSVESAEHMLMQLPPDGWGDLWRDQARGADGDPSRREWLVLYEGLELVQLEVQTTLWEAERMLGVGLPVADNGGWLEIELSRDAQPDGPPVALFASLFAAPTAASIVSVARVSPVNAAALQSAFTMQFWPVHSTDDLAQYFRQGRAHHWAAYDVGQGAANGLLGQNGQLTLMHDIGCGVYRNAKTRPAGLVLCNSLPATIVLSHWDTDHWAGARYFAPPFNSNAFLERTWIVPYDLSIGPRHIAFAVSILAAGGTLVIVPPGPWKSKPIRLADGRRIVLIRGSGLDRNGSGIALEVRDRVLSCRRWLLTGDVDYEFLAPHLARRYVGVAVPHHGAAPSIGTLPPHPEGPYARLVYSFGPDNSFAHPRRECLLTHLGRGWDHGAWTPTLDTGQRAGGNVLATARNAPHSDHLHAAVIGWHSAPSIPLTLPCGGVQCSAVLQQS